MKPSPENIGPQCKNLLNIYNIIMFFLMLAAPFKTNEELFFIYKTTSKNLMSVDAPMLILQ